MEKPSSKSKNLRYIGSNVSNTVVEVPNNVFKYIIIEKGAISKLKTILEPFELPIFVTDNLLFLKYNNEIRSLMEGKRIEWLEVLNANLFLSKKEIKYDIVIGFGGGRSLDVSKLVAKRFKIDWISVPTAASHDGIASDLASVKHNGYNYSEKCKPPLGVVADLSFLESAPPMLKLGGFGDVLSKISSLGEWKLAHEKSQESFDIDIFNSVKSSLDTIFKDNSLNELINAEISCGKAMIRFGNSRPCSGTEHAISHSMDRHLNKLHGLQVAFASLICNYYLEEVGYSIYNNDHLLRFMTQNDMPTKLNDFNLTANQFFAYIYQAIKLMNHRNRYSIFKQIKLNVRSILETIKDIYL